MIDVLGVGAEGVSGLPAPGRALLASAEVVLGPPRLLAGVHERKGRELRAWPSPMLPSLPAIFEDVAGLRVVVLASGDPYISGVAGTLTRLLGAGELRVHPAVSSVALARAAMNWPEDTTAMVSLVSRPVQTLTRELAPGARLIVLSAGRHTPREVAALLVEQGYGAARLSVLNRLGSSDESRIDTTAGDWSATLEPDPLNVVCLDLTDPGLPHGHDAATISGYGITPGLPDEAFETDGQLTKWEVRIAALARLRPLPGQLLWDLGAGAGSISIEWARSHPRCRAVAVERDAARGARIAENAERLGVPWTVQVHCEDVAEAVHRADLPRPDAVFLGGGLRESVIEACLTRLDPGGRLVAHAVTLDSEQLLVQAHQRHGGDLRRLSVERAEPLGRYHSWTPARSVVQWSLAKVAP